MLFMDMHVDQTPGAGLGLADNEITNGATDFCWKQRMNCGSVGQYFYLSIMAFNFLEAFG